MWPGNQTRGYGRRVSKAIILDHTTSMNIYLKLEINMAEGYEILTTVEQWTSKPKGA